MSVVGTAKELIGRRDGSEKADERTYRRVYHVEVNDKNDGPKIVKAAIGIPQLYFGYETESESDTAAIVRDIKARQMPDTPFIWEVEVMYSTKGDGSQPNEPGEGPEQNPLLRIPEFSFGFNKYRVPATGALDPEHFDGITKDDLSISIQSSAGEPFDPPAEKDESRPTLTIKRNELSFNPLVMIEYVDAVNSDFFFGAKPRQAKMQSITMSGRQLENGTFFFPVTYTIEFKSTLWDLQLLDHGTYYLDDDDEKVSFIDLKDQPKIGLLQGDGTAAPLLNGTASPTFLDFRVYREREFGFLNLPQSLGVLNG